MVFIVGSGVAEFRVVVGRPGQQSPNITQLIFYIKNFLSSKNFKLLRQTKGDLIKSCYFLSSKFIS
jgi:hypothetical protein